MKKFAKPLGVLFFVFAVAFSFQAAGDTDGRIFGAINDIEAIGGSGDCCQNGFPIVGGGDAMVGKCDCREFNTADGRGSCSC